MSQGQSTQSKDLLRSELEASRTAFHTLLDSLSDADLKKKSHNAAWTNEHIVFHMAMGFFILPSLVLIALLFGRLPKPLSQLFARLLTAITIPFNWINALGPHIGGIIFTRTSLSNTFDWFHARIIQLLRVIPEQDLQLGMYYPTKWDTSSFKDYMTLEDIFRIPILHFTFHLEQIAR
ncbi:MAG: DinB family protein [Chloroflexi bacterium]|nr:DinB family protein [Chloroflexota bacterium]